MAFLFQVRRHYHAAVGDEEQLVIGGHIQNGHMGHHLAFPDALFLGNDRLQQSAGLEHPLNQHLSPALPDQGNRPLGTGLVPFCLDNLILLQLLSEPVGDGADFLPVSHQNGSNQSVPSGREDSLESVLVMGRGDYRLSGRQIMQFFL